MIIKKNNFLINVAKEDKAFADSIDFVRMNKIIRDFFGIKDVPVKVKFCNSLEEFKFFFPFDFKNWICGFFDNNEVIYVFSPRIIKKATIHKKETISGTIFHELVHIIYERLKLIKINLFFEGLAVYLTKIYEMEKESKYDIDLSKINFEDYPKFSKKVYSDGFKVINKIIEKYGKKELMIFLKTAKTEPRAKSAFKKKFGK